MNTNHVAAAISLLACPALASGQAQQHHLDATELAHGCWGDEQGHLSGGRFLVPSLSDAQREAFQGVQTRGGPDNRIDLVIVGDGYTANEMAQFHLDADTIAVDFFSYEPFITYRPYFRVTKVEVVSNESGVDNDPSPGISRDTAMDMQFWCGGTERLLCVNIGKAWTFAAGGGSPDVDQILAIANSSKYGGAGYSSANVGTASGQNAASVEVAIHEMGHSLGDLADEYTYGGATSWPGGEPGSVNLSIYNSVQQVSLGTKWHLWMGESVAGFDNPVNTYEGGGYSEFGVYRPSNNSMMRSLYRPFNLPGAEKLIQEFYREVSPLDQAPANGAGFGPADTISIVPMQPAGHNLTIEWSVDGGVVPAAAGSWDLDLGSLGLGGGAHTVQLRVVDDTPWVVDPGIRETFLTETRTYTVSAAGCGSVADINGDGLLDLTDIGLFVAAFISNDPDADLADPIGVWDLADLSAFISAFLDGCR
ncbi:MAG: M64 family metallopeptidase [Phycisphaerales bacterium]|nr:M64 family metallopeptidase [Phycisphaerales bacterium]